MGAIARRSFPARTCFRCEGAPRVAGPWFRGASRRLPGSSGARPIPRTERSARQCQTPPGGQRARQSREPSAAPGAGAAAARVGRGARRPRPPVPALSVHCTSLPHRPRPATDREHLETAPAFDFQLGRIRAWPTALYLEVQPVSPFARLVEALVVAHPAWVPYGGEFLDGPHVTVADLLSVDSPQIADPPRFTDPERLSVAMRSALSTSHRIRLAAGTRGGASTLAARTAGVVG